MNDREFEQTEIGKLIAQNNLIRYNILKFLYIVNQESKKTGLEGIVNDLGLPEENVKTNLKFLKGECLVEYIENINGEPILAWGQKGGVGITSKGMELIEEIELQKSEKNKKIRKWILDNASWIVSSILKIIEMLNGR